MGGKWIKKGLIYAVDGRLPWGNSHAQIPTVESKDQSCLSVLFASRDESNRSHIGQLGLNSNDIGQVISLRSAYLKFGEIGTFDDRGVMPSCVVEHNGCRYLYILVGM